LAQITRQEVEHIALLARLAFGPDEIDRFTAQLNDILAHVARLDELDVSQATPTAGVIAGLTTPLREDEVGAVLEREEALAGAPAGERGYFRVPRVIE
jgi:aspartyl-tRNA(Asn)/glutamyl-tRNA(Gln) amidotransferase subunit C